MEQVDSVGSVGGADPAVVVRAALVGGADPAVVVPANPGPASDQASAPDQASGQASAEAPGQASGHASALAPDQASDPAQTQTQTPAPAPAPDPAQAQRDRAPTPAQPQRAPHPALDALQRDPYPLYARARRSEGLTFVPELDAWLVARDADIREVLLRPQDFSSAQALRPDVVPSPAALAVLARGFAARPTVVSTDGPAHSRHRAPLNSGLSAAGTAALTPYIRRQAERLAEALADRLDEPGRAADLMAHYARPLPGAVVGRLLGLDPADVPTAVHGSYSAERLLFRPLAEAEQIAAAEDVLALQRLLDRYARDRRARPRDDLISTMVTALAPDAGLGPGRRELTGDQRCELVSNLQNLLIAGHLTTTALIGGTVLHLLRHPDQWRLLRTRPELVPAAVEEAARYDTPVQGFRRTTTRRVVVAGTELPAGATVFVAYGSGNRDEARHHDPDVFDITRPSPQPRHLAFGHGRHGCPGAQLARVQLRTTLEVLTRRLPDLRLAEGPAPVMRPTLIHRSPEELPVTR
ncbi:cytochrome P450 [Streptomyces sp. NPDC094032]|uniref:cytochrome P450 n=1 Tax=Streptomyces sp. NPDC094032 TaxID=3155308 RepID=UPI0033305409